MPAMSTALGPVHYFAGHRIVALPRDNPASSRGHAELRNSNVQEFRRARRSQRPNGVARKRYRTGIHLEDTQGQAIGVASFFLPIAEFAPIRMATRGIRMWKIKCFRRYAGRLVPDPRSQPYENSFVTGVPVTIRDGREVRSS